VRGQRYLSSLLPAGIGGFDQSAPAIAASNRTINMQRILILENQRLVGAGIQFLLDGEADLDVIGISFHDSEELAQIINKSEPDVIVLDEVGHLTHLTRLLPLLNDWTKLRIVVVSGQDNLIRIYSRQEVFVTRASQLINIIRAG
jgi:chemotaxis response regulator CheB